MTPKVEIGAENDQEWHWPKVSSFSDSHAEQLRYWFSIFCVLETLFLQIANISASEAVWQDYRPLALRIKSVDIDCLKRLGTVMGKATNLPCSPIRMILLGLSTGVSDGKEVSLIWFSPWYKLSGFAAMDACNFAIDFKSVQCCAIGVRYLAQVMLNTH